MDVSIAVLTGLGAPRAQAEVQARWLIEADLRGHPSHGLQRLPVLAERLRRGVLDPSAEPMVDWKSPVAAFVDGRRGFGPWIGLAAIKAARDRARSSGIALAAVANNNHLGLLGPYVEEVAKDAAIGLALTTSEALVHPFNGRVAMIGTNPIAIGVPAHPEPFVLDMATGVVSMGEIIDHANRDVPLPADWAVDIHGEPTTDADRAMRGSIAPFGGAKGYGLGLAFELIVAAVTGAAIGRDVVGTLTTETVCNKGDVFVCIDPTALGRPAFVPAINRYLDELRTSPPREPSQPVLVPGDRARARRTRSMAEGIILADSVWEQIEDLRRSVPQRAAGG